MFDMYINHLDGRIWHQKTFYHHLQHGIDFFIPENGIKHVLHVGFEKISHYVLQVYA